MKVFAPPGSLVGSVHQEWTIWWPHFRICDASGTTVLRIKGLFCTTTICGRDVNFRVMSADGQRQLGRIFKQWSGLARELFTDSDFFGINFPMDLDVKIKAVLLGACFLIDMMYFEN